MADVLGGLSPAFRRFTCDYAGTCAAFPASGNGLLYRSAAPLGTNEDGSSLRFAQLASGAFIYNGFKGSRQVVRATPISEPKSAASSEPITSTPDPTLTAAPGELEPAAPPSSPTSDEATHRPYGRTGQKLSLTFDPTLRRLLDLPKDW